MLATDKNLYCRDCNQEFVFTAGEQEFYESRGLMNAPSRCPACRAARKGQTSYGSSRSYRRDDSRGERQMYTATCASCGNEAQVPFEPREGRPVYCSDCFQSQRSSDRRSRW